MINGARVVVVLPAYNAEKTLERTFAEVPPGVVDQFLLVDDASGDGTVAEAGAAGHPLRGAPAEPRLRREPEDLLHRGAAARRRHRDHVAPGLPVHAEADRGDGMAGGLGRVRRGPRQPDPRDRRGQGRDAALQVRGQPLPDAGREHPARRQALRVPHRLPRLLAGRAARPCRWQRPPTTSSSTTRSSPRRWPSGSRIGEISCPTKYFAEASSISFRRSVTYGFGVLGTALRFRLHRWGLRPDPLFQQHGRRLTSAASPGQTRATAGGRRVS